MTTIEKQRKHDELVKKTNRHVIIRTDPKTGEEYLSGHCVCPNMNERQSIPTKGSRTDPAIIKKKADLKMEFEEIQTHLARIATIQD